MPDLSTLPNELISQIAPYLSDTDLAALNITSRQLHAATSYDMAARLNERMSTEAAELVHKLTDSPVDGSGIDNFLGIWEEKIETLAGIDWSAYGVAPEYFTQ